jgi:hypothetical protein
LGEGEKGKREAHDQKAGGDRPCLDPVEDAAEKLFGEDSARSDEVMRRPKRASPRPLSVLKAGSVAE